MVARNWRACTACIRSVETAPESGPCRCPATGGLSFAWPAVTSWISIWLIITEVLEHALAAAGVVPDDLEDGDGPRGSLARANLDRASLNLGILMAPMESPGA